MFFSLKEEKRSIRMALYAIMAFVLVLSVGTVLYYGDQFLLGTYEKLNNDDVKYMYSAKILLEEGTLVYNSYPEPTLFIMPGMPFILSFFMLIFGDYEHTAIAFRLFQCLLQVLSIYLVFVIARYMFHSKAALIACMISALYLPHYFTSGVILSEGLFCFLFLCLICMSIAAHTNPSVGKYIGVGILVALLCYLKPQMFLFPLVLGTASFLRFRSWKRIFLYGLTIGITFCVLLSPWWIRNYVDFGKFTPFTDSAGNPLLQGLQPGEPSPEFYNQYPEFSSDDSSIDKIKQIILFNLKTKPFQTIKWYTFDKIKDSFTHAFYWVDIWKVKDIAMDFLHIGLSLLGFLGLVIALIRRKANLLLPALVLVYYVGIHLPFVSFSRYMYPIMFIFIIMNAFLIQSAIQWIYEMKREKRRNPQIHPIEG